MDNKEASDFQVIRERIKDKPLDRGKLLRRFLLSTAFAVFLAIIAAFVFVTAVKKMYPEISTTLVSIPRDETPESVSGDKSGNSISSEPRLVSSDGLEDKKEETAVPIEALSGNEAEALPPQVINQITERISLTTEDYKELFRNLQRVCQDVERSLVTVTATASDQDWFENTYENTAQASGIVIANNGKELLILVESAEIEDYDTLSVSFVDGTSAQAEVKSSDPDTGLEILGVLMSDISDDTMGRIREAKLGNSSLVSIVGTPVMAVGRPFGTAGSHAFGLIISNFQEMSLIDRNVRIINTDIYGSTSATGVIANYESEILGVISGKTSSRDTANLLSAYSISDLKALIEKMSNGVSEAYLGIQGSDVTKEAHEEDKVPFGAYVKSVVLDSPAMMAGIQSGDVVTKIGTQEILHFTDLTDAVMKSQPGDDTVVTVERFSHGSYTEMTFDVTFDSHD